MSAKIKFTNELPGKIQVAPDFLPSPAKAAFRDEDMKAARTLLKILAIGNQDVVAGRLKPARKVIARLRAKRISG